MLNLLTEIKALDTTTPQPARPRLEPRRTRRQKARDAAKPNRSVGAAAAPTSLEAQKKTR